MISPDIGLWLQERTALGILPAKVLEAIAQEISEQIVPANQHLVVENTIPDGLYILIEGQLESDRHCQTGATWIGLLPGATINLRELLLNEPAPRTIATLSECKLWFIPAARFRSLVVQYTEITQAFSQQLAQEVAQLSSRLSYDRERQAALLPYLVTKANRGVVGKSRYAVRLRQQILEASRVGDSLCDSTYRRSVLIFGEPGLEKDNLAALIHFGSDRRRQPMIKVNCNVLSTSGAELFGRVGGKVGLLEWLGDGTLLLNNVQDLHPELMPKIARLLASNTYTPVEKEGEEGRGPEDEITSQAKIMAIAERNLPAIETQVGYAIKVPPLRVRKADIKDQLEYYVNLLCRKKGLGKNRVTPEALRRLQSYDFPGNLRELESLVERALVQSNCASELTEEIFWAPETKKKLFRVNLLNAYPWLRRFLRSPWWPDRINYGFTLWFFAVVVAVLFVAPQNRAENLALNMFWAWWWPLILLGFPFVGRLWCAVCPFMIYGEVTQKLSLWLFPRQLKKWPREAAEKWGGWFLWGLFTLIFLWEELWNLENTADLSACLLLLITAGAMICSAIFERRFWCRYLCPIGGMNGLFAKLSMTELRAQQGTCSAECTTYQCYKGGPKKGEGLETGGCPLYSHPAQLEDNRDCVLCMTCLKACPHRSVELNLRPPGIELWTTHVPRAYEVALLLLLLGGVFLHRLPQLQSLLGLNFDLERFFPHLGLSLLALIVPASIPLLAYGGIWLLPKLSDKYARPRPFVELAYGYLPLVLGANLAHYLNLGLGEAGQILPVTWATFGLKMEGLPVWVAPTAVISFLQGSTLIISVLLSIFITQKIARQPVRSHWPQHLGVVLLAASLWTVIISNN
ncbi:sigma 54-interacting transcriptional regulator [Merismopedia glauca]|uniref:AAA family ATPase n=1 Tax=Merismopedia glauca CCAP 1448/3 TaxID=1296344 RepID=A0A2T1BZT8_9CYAN|nr:sigma 54-interacting transcriptional regulator [Merismopedia glauca]PSB01536.1 AAA family ATPase [Merismopedia glauca CCAP 1448/3]